MSLPSNLPLKPPHWRRFLALLVLSALVSAIVSFVWPPLALIGTVLILWIGEPLKKSALRPLARFGALLLCSLGYWVIALAGTWFLTQAQLIKPGYVFFSPLYLWVGLAWLHSASVVLGIVLELISQFVDAFLKADISQAVRPSTAMLGTGLLLMAVCCGYFWGAVPFFACAFLAPWLIGLLIFGMPGEITWRRDIVFLATLLIFQAAEIVMLVSICNLPSPTGSCAQVQLSSAMAVSFYLLGAISLGTWILIRLVLRSVRKQAESI